MFENSNKTQKVILSISFVVFLFIILSLIVEELGLMVTFVALMVLAITTIFFYRLWADKK